MAEEITGSRYQPGRGPVGGESEKSYSRGPVGGERSRSGFFEAREGNHWEEVSTRQRTRGR